MNVIGEIKLKAFPKEVIVRWKIEKFSSLSELNYSSRLFLFANLSWSLRIYPKGNCIKDQHICLYLRKNSFAPSDEIEYSFSLKSLYEKKVLERHQTNVFKKGEMGHGFDKFVTREELLKRKCEFMPSDTLTVICTLMRSESTEVGNTSGEKCNENESSSDEEDNIKDEISSKIKGLEILSENLKQMLLEGQMSDAVFKADGKTFNVHKSILVARSPVFASMFRHDLSEKNTNEVDVPDCTAESFEVFLHYLYSASIGTLSTSNVYNVYYAADKYQVDDLKEKCVKFMMKNITVETFCDVITLSLRHGESKLQKLATDFFRQNIKIIIKTVQWQKYMDENSTQANELLIKALNA